MANNPWWPRADNTIQRAPQDGGSILAGYPPKGLWHTTETAGWPGYGSGSFPHLTVKVEAGRFLARQHIPFTRAARALRNPVGGVQTNRIVRCQVEIVTFADIVDERGLDPAMEAGLADLAVWLEGEWGVPRTCGVTFKPYPQSFGDNGVRLTGTTWEQYSGWLGHQHAAENDHGDPGALDWRRILRPAPEEDEMSWSNWTNEERAALVDAVADEVNSRLVATLRAGFGGLHPGAAGPQVRPSQDWLYERVDSIGGEVDGLVGQVTEIHDHLIPPPPPP